MSHGHGSGPKHYGARLNLTGIVPDVSDVLKPGSKEHLRQVRKEAAELVRDIRNMWPQLKGKWTRREWNRQARAAGQRHITNTIRHMRINRG